MCKSQATKHGKGLFTTEAIIKGQYVGEYKGRHLSGKELDELTNETYLYVYRLNGKLHGIDASDEALSGILRYANDEWRSPNTRMEKVMIEGKSFLFLKTICDIPANTELRYDYNFPDSPWRESILEEESTTPASTEMSNGREENGEVSELEHHAQDLPVHSILEEESTTPASTEMSNGREENGEVSELEHHAQDLPVHSILEEESATTASTEMSNGREENGEVSELEHHAQDLPVHSILEEESTTPASTEMSNGREENGEVSELEHHAQDLPVHSILEEESATTASTEMSNGREENGEVSELEHHAQDLPVHSILEEESATTASTEMSNGRRGNHTHFCSLLFYLVCVLNLQ
ncbi:histone-lysine N-methyltransferase ASH1L isoform X2 [Strongylocentrotus purpuratus]|uniref:SET domain-containing protein n=1 Tax=Strongylocentrotus purpuratus TaxID=7668 RepID=A0A7M7PUP6_STRPU|nr:histone-lysine N-methyltransferase ASH1L isoform X2 [Strongylocentrotus purpuratus]XP_030856058.1 histone-lysine N-methyltransferase ASH1L isoform X2 [Strongylocentrotus purpuratus]